jgi:RNA polymerase sigma-70 factor (ECF subfamily)
MNTPDLAQQSWHRFLESIDPLRPQLYRYSRYLTRSPWDAEDLTQDALARAFVTLARMGGREPENPRAWLFRIASNLWIDEVRKRRDPPAAQNHAGTSSEPQAAREAAGTLLVTLSPQERAAVVLKDAFDLPIDEIAETLGTTTGAVKAALHRGRGKLADEGAPEPQATPAPGAIDAFCAAFNAGDIDRVTALLLDTAVVEVVGATTQYGPEAARRTVLSGMLFGMRVLANPEQHRRFDAGFDLTALAEPPRCEARLHRGRWVLLHWHKHADGVEAVRAFTSLEVDGDRVARLSNYFFTPDFIADLGGELGVPVRSNGRRWWFPEAGGPAGGR